MMLAILMRDNTDNSQDVYHSTEILMQIIDPQAQQHAPIMRSACFRFYQELNDFLLQKQRKRTFSYAFSGNPSVKDTIEAIGVPHTEIDVILVNGESVGFEYQMQGGEYVSVYPEFESVSIIPLVHLRSPPPRETKFVVDVNLGKLAIKLRLLGFDTLYRKDFSDSEIVKRSLDEKRIILTRDKGIFKYRAVTHGYWVRSDDPKRQLREVITRLQLENRFRPFTRCSNCNEQLHPVESWRLKGRIPDDILLFSDGFMECEGCEKIYWRGSHYDRICKWIDQLKVN
ncbi:Mut7-C RNAse domain-containing protein [Photobacterium sp.]|uniref:Mut7-C RNAse domain-containing protein n=1 Tax=Photobacterium sp. TaxID=660 RepID=UPI00299EE375|nr:Mut7-C RNAse domain-containing protein [Photobacterium sp.]MDX1303024.1 Mut7-C RNAse domain-containing protein [Photobacterium sp.]